MDKSPTTSEFRSHAIIDASPVPMALNDEQQRITYLNPAFVTTFGYTIEDIPTLVDWWPKAYPNLEYRQWIADNWQAELGRAKRTGSAFSPIEVSVRCKDGSDKTVLASASSLSNAFAGEHLVILYDITDRKKIEEELQTNRQRLEALSRQLITTQETERRHLARELHDEIGQVLTAIKMNLRRSQRVADEAMKASLEENVAMVDQTIGQVRNLSLSLRPPQLDELGLVAALHWLVKHHGGISDFQVQLDADLGDVEIPADLATVCFRIAQESLTNALRHGQPRKILVELHADQHAVFLTVQDDGVGFDVAQARQRAASGASVGLLSMQERASLVGGELTIDSVRGLGSTIQARFPLRT